MTNQYDLVVLGAGPGGYVAAIRAAQLGLKTAIIEREYWGGVCLNVGCIPSKALLKNAEIAHTLQHRAREFGFSFTDLQLDYSVAFKRSRQVSSRLVKGVQFLMKKNKIDVFEGTGQLTDANTVQVSLNDSGEQTISGKNIIIATGARPRSIPGIEFDGERIISYKDAILSDSPPEKLIIVGGGVIGVEFTYMWANYGVDVTIVEMMDRLLPNEEPEISSVLEKAYKKLKVKLHMNSRVDKIETTENGIAVALADGTKLEGDKVMLAINFAPNVENIGLESAGVALTERGAIAIDDQMRTNVPNIYAIGDVATEYRLAHIASAMGLVAAEAIAGHETHALDYRMMPRATYCVPQVASFGYTEAQAKEAGYELNVGQFPFQANGKALGLGEREGFIKIIADKQYGEILGAHMVGPDVTELLPELTLAHNAELTAEEIARNVHAHPTLSEALMEAAHAVEGEAIHI
ncbi:dihydrolipoyl dehydrogenase [Candidatus Leptofilum sp.]|uniref:dihydrolipoyl dehydrogenase n=1 Tax=Candidatus Leptofilum sp. TaxID=3241576 RepID=UPI003B5A69BE